MPTFILCLVWYLYFLLVDPAHQSLVPHVVDDPPAEHLLCQAGAHHSVVCGGGGEKVTSSLFWFLRAVIKHQQT